MSTTTARPSSTRRAPLVPDQHGAWAFLVLPVALAAPVLAWHPVLVPLVAAWVAAYPAAWALAGRLAAPRPERFDRALRVWAPPAVACALVAVAWRPWLLAVGALYAAGFLVSLRYARARRERALANDVVLVAQCAAMVPVLVAASGRPLGAPVPLLTAVGALALLGSTLHVKSLIRERRRPAYRWVSLGLAAACLLASVLASPLVGVWLVVPAAAAVLRSLIVTDPTWRPARIGMVELAVLVVLAVCAWWA